MPDRGTVAATTPLGRLLAARIARLGAITVADYMAEVLTHPEHGYYMSGDPFGARGDFVTAPEISQMFGELIGLWCADTWQHMGGPDPVILVELGPGRGTLMADALRAADSVPSFAQALRLHLVEFSPALRALQGQALAERAGAVEPCWHDGLASVPEGPLLLIANEFFDALPVRQFEHRAEGWCERVVTLAADGHSLTFALGPPSPAAHILLPPALHESPIGATAEVSPAGLLLATELGHRVATHGGAALIIDYGHARPHSGTTLQAVRRHAAHDVLADPGSADLTAHVDFAAIARAAVEAGARAYGPVSQGLFLEQLGIEARTRALLAAATPAQAEDIAAARDRLISAEAMGELFQVLALTHKEFAAPAGFS